MPVKNQLKVARLALATLSKDRDERLEAIDRYEKGDQDLPYTPDSADAEYKKLARKSITNVLPFIIGTPCQMMYADAFRRGRTSTGDGPNLEARVETVQPEWDHWQASRLDARQGSIYYGALKFGHSFVLTEKSEKDEKVYSKGMSALTTTALYTDPANDDDPYAALHVVRWPDAENELGLARMWDDTYEYFVDFKALDDEESVVVRAGKKHGATECPVTRFAAAVDLEGRTVGIVEPMFVLQDRINQTVFDLLIVQSYASFKVRTISGMAPPVKMRPYDVDGNLLERVDNIDDVYEWKPEIDPNTGRAVIDEVNLNAKRLFFAKDPETKFGTLDETPLDGFIAAIELGFRHMAALTQTPPHHILGEISNISAEALNAAETALARKVDGFKASFGESWERVFRIAAQIGEYEGADDFNGETVWRDMGNVSLAQSADALGKLAESLGIPRRGLWGRVPNVTATEMAAWEDLYEQENGSIRLSNTPRPATASTRPSFRLDSGADSGGNAPQPEAAVA